MNFAEKVEVDENESEDKEDKEDNNDKETVEGIDIFTIQSLFLIISNNLIFLLKSFSKLQFTFSKGTIH